MFKSIANIVRKVFTRNLPVGANLASADELRAKLASGQQVRAIAGNTQSMFPKIRGGETIIIENWSYRDLKVGQFVIGTTVFSGVPAMHEIISGDSARGFVVKGMGNPAPDPFLLTPDRYIGTWRIA